MLLNIWQICVRVDVYCAPKMCVCVCLHVCRHVQDSRTLPSKSLSEVHFGTGGLPKPQVYVGVRGEGEVIDLHPLCLEEAFQAHVSKETTVCQKRSGLGEGEKELVHISVKSSLLCFSALILVMMV